MSNISSLASKLHPLERKVLPHLLREKEVSLLARAAKVDETEAMRALQWLENKGAVKIQVQVQKQILLEKNGYLYKKSGLPERRFLQALGEEKKGLNVILKKAKLSREEGQACLGLLRKKGAIELQKAETGLSIHLTAIGKKLVHQEFPEEQFLQETFPLEKEKTDQILVQELLQRKEIISLREHKHLTFELTLLGKELASAPWGGEVLNRLTPKMLKDGSWKTKEFREYDVEINVPQKYGGRIHFVQQAIDYIRQIWLEMGFQEMTGNYVQSAFWDLDALFVPQDHPAREMQDTFYLENTAQLPPLWKKIKEVHENGGATGSNGWGGSWKPEEAAKVLLRTHTTVLSALTLAHLKKEQLPAKFFAVGKVFRNEAVDWKHLFEFEQVEGIVIDPHANLSHLKGYLTQFYKKMGYEKVRMRPAHFPYTEPSLEVEVFHPQKKKWVELGGAGIFRPEVVIPLLGFDCPVLAWGQGMGRIISEYWNIQDIRELYKNDVKQLREMKVWLK